MKDYFIGDRDMMRLLFTQGFEKVAKSQKSLQMYHADWAQPSKAHKKTLSGLSKELGVPLRLVDVDDAKNSDEVSRNKVRGLPYVTATENGKIIDGYVGNRSRKAASGFLQQHFAAKRGAK
jgi:thioredoxin-like negative regulator of GroEL